MRGAPARLEVPTPDGSVLSAERSVFEDRGGGDLMWSGGQPGAGYDTVVLTVEGGRLVGRFAAAGGGAYQIHAERDGRGGMAPLVGPGLEGLCRGAAWRRVRKTTMTLMPTSGQGPLRRIFRNA